MIRVSDGRIEVVGSITMNDAADLLVAGESAIDQLSAATDKTLQVDLASAKEIDSSCLALIFAWMRKAQSLGLNLRLLNVPENLRSLAVVYDVSDLLPA
jgi:phospholipid transport system transporter-binding protein